MKPVTYLQSSLCVLFGAQVDQYTDENNVQRIVTPMRYSESRDHIVIRVRPTPTAIQIDEAGDAAMYSALAGGNTGTEHLVRWEKALAETSPVRIDADDVLVATTTDPHRVPGYVFRVAEAAQQFYTLATASA